MGVPGFLSHLQKNEKLFFKRRKLQNTHLVVDGLNFMYHVYSSVLSKSTSWKFGGDYDTYYDALVRIFENFNSCNITVIVIIDGFADSKRNRIRLDRWIDSCKSLRYLTSQGKIRNIYPILMGSVFKAVLNEFGIIHFRTLLEADQDLAITAHSLNCPVLSNDTDFCFYQVEFIVTYLTDLTLKYDETKAPGHFCYLEVQVFDREAFLKKTNLNKELFLLVPLFFGSYLPRDHELIKLFKDETKINLKYELDDFFKWMAEMGSCQSVVSYISKRSENFNEADLNGIINEVCELFTVSNKLNSPLVIINKNKGNLTINEDIKPHSLPKEHPLSRFSENIIKGYVKNEISWYFISGEFCKEFNCHIQCEDVNAISPEFITLPLLSAQFGIYDKIAGYGTSIVRLLRIRKRYGFQEIQLHLSEKFLENMPNEIFTEKTECRRLLFLEIIGCDRSTKFDWNEIDDNWQLFIGSVAYWLKNKKHFLNKGKSSQVKLESVIMAALANYTKYRTKTETIFLLEKVHETELLDFDDRMSEFRMEKEEVNYNTSIVHELALLQKCLAEFSSLNNCLNKPFPEMKIMNFFSGTIVYNLNHEMVNSNFTQKVLPLTSNLLYLFHYLVKKVEELSNCLATII